MRIDGRRNFKYNGKRYWVQNLPKQDKKADNEKYYLLVESEGFWKPAYNTCGWVLEHFTTIKEAQRFVRDWDFLIDTLY